VGQNSGVTASVLAVVASTIFLVRLLPQPLRMARTGWTGGVSGLAALNGLVADVAWLSYGLAAGLAAVWLVSVAAMVPAVWLAVLLRQRIGRRDVALAAAWAAVLVGCALAGVLGAGLAAGVVVTQGPAVGRALRDRDLSGISPATWWVSVADGLSWGAYGLAVHDGALQGYCVVLVTSAALVLGRLRLTVAGSRKSSCAAP